MADRPIFTGAFPAGEEDEFSGRGVRPVVFDILGPDWETSILPEGVRLVLHVNPNSMTIKWTRSVVRIQTKSGFVEQHFGDNAQNIDFDVATGGFKRLYTGLTSTTSPNQTGGTRRETLSYDSYLDLLALFHNNGSVYDAAGQVVLQGIIKVIFDGGVYFGWFDTFNVTEDANKPFQFTLTAAMTISHESQVWRTAIQLGDS